MGVYQGSVLSPFLFNIVFDYLLENLMNEPNVTSLFFADDVAIISNSAVDLQNTLDKWRSALEETVSEKVAPKLSTYPVCFPDL